MKNSEKKLFIKKRKKEFIMPIAALASVVFGLVLVRALFYSPASDITDPHTTFAAVPVQSTTDPSGTTHAIVTEKVVSNQSVTAAPMLSYYPVSLSIPAINVQAHIQEVGLTKTGNMAVPTNFTDVGWYDQGTVPGDIGSAVIDGHVDDGLAFPAVLANLAQLNSGDAIYITMNNGTILHFVMTGSQAYDKNTNANEIFNEKDGRILRLITCTGDWLPLLRTHDQRLVVTAVLEPS